MLWVVGRFWEVFEFVELPVLEVLVFCEIFGFVEMPMLEVLVASSN